jgi:hypothetical protein
MLVFPRECVEYHRSSKELPLSYNNLILYINHAFPNKATQYSSQIKAHVNIYFFVCEIIFFKIIKDSSSGPFRAFREIPPIPLCKGGLTEKEMKTRPDYLVSWHRLKFQVFTHPKWQF